MKPYNTFSLKRTDMEHIKVGLTPANQSEGITEQEGRPLRRSFISSLLTSAVKFLDVDGRPKNLNDTITLELGNDFHSNCRMQSQEETEVIQRTEETSTRMSLEAESNLPITPRLIMLDDPWPMLSGHLHKTNNNENKLSCHLARRCLCPIGFLSATVLIFFPSFTRLLKSISATYTLIVTCIGSPYKSMNSVHKARSGFSAGQSSSFTPHTLIHVVDPVLCNDLVV
ncbi:uncharacterized protein LOC120719984 isoform X3 [Simochromis diagramma]|uniref:uncharacterized protein LOC120719984 isoform X3 n=1 Tax=Simochromis diagramma TaxID=43689 RepID=UPI001A7EB9B8|nr:uncharacterized protein LOC120719984 isoform X3 [Simochromis diagramma]